MTRWLSFATACLLVLVSCGQDDENSPATPSPTASTARPSASPADSTTVVPPPATSTQPVATPVPTTTAVATTTTADAPTTATVPSTTMPDPSGRDVWTLPPALPGDEIPWDEIGPDWLLISYAPLHDDWGPSVPHVLYMVDHEDRLFEVGVFGDPERWWQELQDWSADGRYALSTNHGDETELWLIDLDSGIHHLVMSWAERTWVTARFGGPADSLIVVRQVEEFSSRDEARRIRLDVLDRDGTPLAGLIDMTEPYELGEPSFYRMGVTWHSLSNGNGMVVADAGGIRLLDEQGDLVSQLDSPGRSCEVVRSWGDDAVLVSCIDTEWWDSECREAWGHEGTHGLWALPIDGAAPSSLVELPAPDEDCSPYFFVDALRIGDTVALGTEGCCECGADLFLGAVGERWDPADFEVCSPELISVRHGTFLVSDVMRGPDDGPFYRALVEVAADGSIIGFVGPAGDITGVIPHD